MVGPPFRLYRKAAFLLRRPAPSFRGKICRLTTGYFFGLLAIRSWRLSAASLILAALYAVNLFVSCQFGK